MEEINIAIIRGMNRPNIRRTFKTVDGREIDRTKNVKAMMIQLDFIGVMSYYHSFQGTNRNQTGLERFLFFLLFKDL